MLDNQITLAVDPLNTGTTVSKVYRRFDTFQNRSIFIGDGHSSAARNNLSFYRSFPSRVGNFRGVAKTSVKFTEDVTVSGVDSTATLTAPVIVEVNFSFPVGVTTAHVKEMRQRVIALLDQDSIMDNLNNIQEI